MLFDDRSRAIFQAQWRGLIHKYPRGSVGGKLFTAVMMVAWYGLVVFFAWLVATALPEVRSASTVRQAISIGAALALVYWQVIPVLLVSGGMSLQLKRLSVYPIAPFRLFAIEVLLRITTGLEPLIVMIGAMFGLWANPLVPAWAPLALLPFALMNMLLSAGLRDLLMRLLSRRGIREVVVLLFVLISVLPQLLIALFPPSKWKGLAAKLPELPSLPWPWTVVGSLASGQGNWVDLLWLMIWLAAASHFGYSQFRRNLRWDADEGRAAERKSASPRSIAVWEAILRLPSRLLPDPLGLLVEKEIRTLSRSPRFRLVFFMGFTFGLAIWLPLFLRSRNQSGFFADNLLVMLCLYAALLMGDVLFWNFFGFDRQAVQSYFVMPVRLAKVILAKNIAAVALLLLEVSMVALAVSLLGLPITAAKVFESYAVSALYCLFFVAGGNLASIHHPRVVDPSQSWRNNSNLMVQGYLMLALPFLSIPAGLAYLARYAFQSQAAFYGVLAIGYVVAGITYWVSLDSAVATATANREKIVEALSRGDGPVG